MKNFYKWAGIILGILLFIIFALYDGDLSVEEARAVLADKQSQFVSIKGMDVHYKREGKGFPIVLVHGTGALLQTWDGWTEILTDNGYEVIRMDMQSFGLTGPSPDQDYSMPSYVDFLDQFIQEMQIDSFHLAGNSLGGQIAWEYAVQHQEKVSKLILLAPTGFSSGDGRSSLAFQIAKNKPLAMMVKNLGTRFMLQKTLTDVYFDEDRISEELVEKYYAATKREGNRTAFIYRVNQESVGNTDALKTLRVPTLLMWGDHDVLVPHELAEHFQEYLPNDTLILYRDMGHIPMEEIPVRTVRDAMEFLQQ